MRFFPPARAAALPMLLTVSLLLVAPARAQPDDNDDDGPPPPNAMPASLGGFTPDTEAEAAALQVLKQFGRMWESEDMDTFDRIIARDAEMVVIGTDAAEFIVGYEDFRKARAAQFASFENVEFNVKGRSLDVSESGAVAWFTEQFDLFTVAEGDPVSLEDLRLSGVMEKRDGQWQMVQLHTSMPVEGRAAEY
jgi:ketosteroid isomerase-like protein